MTSLGSQNSTSSQFSRNSNDDFWVCRNCTLNNSLSATICNACHAQRHRLGSRRTERQETPDKKNSMKCLHCTFDNQSGASTCAFCDKELAVSKMSQHYWPCSQCTLNNSFDLKYCAACGHENQSHKNGIKNDEEEQELLERSERKRKRRRLTLSHKTKSNQGRNCKHTALEHQLSLAESFKCHGEEINNRSITSLIHTKQEKEQFSSNMTNSTSAQLYKSSAFGKSSCRNTPSVHVKSEVVQDEDDLPSFSLLPMDVGLNIGMKPVEAETSVPCHDALSTIQSQKISNNLRQEEVNYHPGTPDSNANRKRDYCSNYQNYASYIQDNIDVDDNYVKGGYLPDSFLSSSSKKEKKYLPDSESDDAKSDVLETEHGIEITKKHVNNFDMVENSQDSCASDGFEVLEKENVIECSTSNMTFDDVFGKDDSGEEMEAWKCSRCFHQNDADSHRCCSCYRKRDINLEEINTEPFWSCEICGNQKNSNESPRCQICETPRGSEQRDTIDKEDAEIYLSPVGQKASYKYEEDDEVIDVEAFEHANNRREEVSHLRVDHFSEDISDDGEDDFSLPRERNNQFKDDFPEFPYYNSVEYLEAAGSNIVFTQMFCGNRRRKSYADRMKKRLAESAKRKKDAKAYSASASHCQKSNKSTKTNKWVKKKTISKNGKKTTKAKSEKGNRPLATNGFIKASSSVSRSTPVNHYANASVEFIGATTWESKGSMSFVHFE